MSTANWKTQTYGCVQSLLFNNPHRVVRYLVRGEEMRQSVRIIRQVIKNFPGGPWYATDARKIFAPPKDKILTSMEELIQNFMLVTEGPQMPAGEVYFEQIDANSLAVSPPIGAPDDAANRKHPALAANANGKVLMAWTEGTGWHKGGSLAWQLFDSAGKPLAAKGSLPGIPAWDLPAVFADRDGNFTVVY